MIPREAIKEFCLTLPGVYLDYPFDEEWQALRIRENHKSFAFIFKHQGKLYVNVKCEPLKAQFLREMYLQIIPGYHMNKKHWNSIVVDEDLSEGLLWQLIKESYELVYPKKKVKKNE